MCPVGTMAPGRASQALGPAPQSARCRLQPGVPHHHVTRAPRHMQCPWAPAHPLGMPRLQQRRPRDRSLLSDVCPPSLGLAGCQPRSQNPEPSGAALPATHFLLLFLRLPVPFLLVPSRPLCVHCRSPAGWAVGRWGSSSTRPSAMLPIWRR